ncbi:hypothetical protein Mapa_016232 [Marchantia paleacea]|nr:hypothetical protein Mapa_016232 [Marchantia paleacea]
MARRAQSGCTDSVLLVPFLVLTTLSALFHGPAFSAHAWGSDGHHVICNIAEALLNEIAREAVEALLPDNADGNLSSICLWADSIKRQDGYRWSAPLHYINTPNGACDYKYIRDCRDDVIMPGFCASGAINNYTTQMDTDSDQHNLTEALMFISHLVADIHQPLHVGFEGDRGGNSVDLFWYNTRTNLHHVWDADMITKSKNVYFGGDISRLTKALLKNITSVWERDAKAWSTCGGGEIACPDQYARESVKLACQHAYPDAQRGAVLSDAYFQARIPIAQKRLAQAAVRLAAILNAIYAEV